MPEAGGMPPAMSGGPAMPGGAGEEPMPPMPQL